MLRTHAVKFSPLLDGVSFAFARVLRRVRSQIFHSRFMSYVWISVVLVLLGLAVTVRLLARSILHQNNEPFEGPLLDVSAETKSALAAWKADDNATAPLFAPPLRTRGRHIVDSSGKRFKLASVNWYGASDELHIPGGLDIRHRDDISRTIRELGFNSVRLPYADQMVRDNRIIARRLVAANADLAGANAMDVYAAVVNSLTEAGLAVIVNNHITQCRWCCDGNLCDATWANSLLGPFCSVRQTEDDWIEHWEAVLAPHIDNPLVVGADLRNEPRALFGSMGWATWAAAAERVGERLLSMQPNWLIIVEGTGSANHLARVRSRPVTLSLPDRLVYSAHVYGWSGWGSLSPYWSRPYQSFADEMYYNWAYLLEDEVAPVWIGEIGVPSDPNKGDVHYWQNLMRYLQLVDADFGYWALNPRKPRDNEREKYSVLEDDWETPLLDYRLHDMLRLMR